MRFETVFGKPPGERPASYFKPWLGDYCGVQASEIEHMSPSQLLACWDYTRRD